MRSRVKWPLSRCLLCTLPRVLQSICPDYWYCLLCNMAGLTRHSAPSRCVLNRLWFGHKRAWLAPDGLPGDCWRDQGQFLLTLCVLLQYTFWVYTIQNFPVINTLIYHAAALRSFWLLPVVC